MALILLVKHSLILATDRDLILPVTSLQQYRASGMNLLIHTQRTNLMLPLSTLLDSFLQALDRLKALNPSQLEHKQLHNLM